MYLVTFTLLLFSIYKLLSEVLGLGESVTTVKWTFPSDAIQGKIIRRYVTIARLTGFQLQLDSDRVNTALQRHEIGLPHKIPTIDKHLCNKFFF